MALNYTNIFFIDIETVAQVYTYSELSEQGQKLFSQKVRYALENSDKSIDELYTEKAGILSEFNKIVCISVCVITIADNQANFHTTSFYGNDENDLLNRFAVMLSKSDKSYTHLCAHNGKEFDFPVLCRRLLVNNIDIPPILDIRNKKPWEINYIDTLDYWKFGDYKHYTSLDLLAYTFNIESPKNDISGADVASVYYEEKDIERIKTYCEKDTITLAKVYLRMAHNKIL